MNAYYSEIMFRGPMGDLNLPGVITADIYNGELINIHPVGPGMSVSSVALCSSDIVAIVSMAKEHGMFSASEIQQIRKILR